MKESVIVRAPEEAGPREKTVILFTGDNGTGGQGKSTATEKGARVPLIVNGPGLVKPWGGRAFLRIAARPPADFPGWRVT